ncbi:hypothetical protein CesoFtcFv8_025198 [Champsocephalus esox]|uniref:Uncharacterized protein n=1 Tax=Champsocephalus esox TaxID=159716 RepID=A0AAN8GGL2_9TELE|nr:hypothetical protein CesoFtcFv8_025198 [Champsocephalus esox]
MPTCCKVCTLCLDIRLDGASWTHILMSYLMGKASGRGPRSQVLSVELLSPEDEAKWNTTNCANKGNA